MSFEKSLRWAEAALLLGASTVAGCGSRSELSGAQPNSCEDTANAQVLCCEEKKTPDWQGIIDVTTVQQTPEQLCRKFSDGTAAVICFLDQPWDKFLAKWATVEVDKYGDTIYHSDSYKTADLPGEIECTYSSYADENGKERVNADCQYWEYDTGFQADIWRWEPREYPGYSEVGMDFTTPGEPYKGFIIGALYVDPNPTPESGQKANIPYVWMNGVEKPNDSQDGECGLDYKSNDIPEFSAKIAEIAQRVVLQ